MSRGTGQRIGSKEARDAARLILDSEEYRATLKSRAAAGTLPAAVEIMLWHYRYGKPPDKIEITSNHEDLANLTSEELAERAKEIAGDMAHISELLTEVQAVKPQVN